MITDSDRARLELAQKAWKVASASDREVEAAVRRVAYRMRTRSRAHASRPVLTLVTAALALFAALAYGQTGGFEHPPAFATRWFGPAPGRALDTGIHPPAVKQAARLMGQRYLELAPVPEPPSGTPVDPSQLPTIDTASRLDSADRQSASGPEQGRKAQRSRALRGARNAAPAKRQAAGSTWREIDQALAAGNDRLARRHLQKLAKDGAQDATTRAKARLGLAQLSQARGDCQRASILAEAVARSEGVDEIVVKRAHDIVLRCK